MSERSVDEILEDFRQSALNLKMRVEYNQQYPNRILCICGGHSTKSNSSRHWGTKKHMAYICEQNKKYMTLIDEINNQHVPIEF